MKKSEIPMDLLDVGHDKYLGWNHYMVSGAYSWAVVASLQFVGPDDGDLLGWTAFCGGCDVVVKEEDVVRWVAEHGNEMTQPFAASFFPGLPIEMYRD